MDEAGLVLLYRQTNFVFYAQQYQVATESE